MVTLTGTSGRRDCPSGMPSAKQSHSVISKHEVSQRVLGLSRIPLLCIPLSSAHELILRATATPAVCSALRPILWRMGRCACRKQVASIGTATRGCWRFRSIQLSRSSYRNVRLSLIWTCGVCIKPHPASSIGTFSASMSTPPASLYPSQLSL